MDESVKVTPDNRPLSALEAAILGLYLVRFDCLCKLNQYGDPWEHASVKDRYGLMAGGSSISCFPSHDILHRFVASMESDTLDIHDWLTARGITPPEVA